MVRFRRRLFLAIGLVLAVILVSCSMHSRNPSPRYGSVMVYDSLEGRMLLFGGRGEGLFGEKCKNDLWAFDLQQRKWSEIDTSNQPAQRLSPGLIYDPGSHRLVLFGGLTIYDRLDDTWILDLESMVWQELQLASSPSARSDMDLAVDPERRIALLYSGYCEETQHHLCNDTWLFDLDDLTWIKQDPVSSPPISYGHRLVFDQEDQLFLIWGGHESEVVDGRIHSLGYGEEFWSYQVGGDQWNMFGPEPRLSPRARYWHHLISLSLDQELLLFSGDGGHGYLPDTWLYSLSNQDWKQVGVADPPLPRINGAAAYDPSSGMVVLFGGIGEGFNVLGDTWLFSVEDRDWIEVE